MRLLDDVRLIESEVLAPPIVSTFGQHLIDRAHDLQVMNSAILEKFYMYFISHGTMIGGHRWQKIHGKIVVLSRDCETHFEESDCPRSKEYHDVEYRQLKS